MIEGVLGSFFSDNHTSEDLRKAYSRVVRFNKDGFYKPIAN